MERNPKKSKALIITFIIVLLLLIAGYFVLKNSESIFGTKGSSKVNKIFAPLLGSSKPKDINVVNPNTTDPNLNGGSGDNLSDTTSGDITPTDFGTTPTDNTSWGSTGGSTGGSSAIVPPFNPIPTPGSTNTNPAICRDTNGNIISCASDNDPVTRAQCADGIDNDGDNFKDGADSGCHTDYNKSNSLSYDRNINDESRTGTTTTTVAASMCPDDPLEFTEDEKAQLAVLLRQYYLLAPSLRIEDDVTLVDYDNQTNEELIKQATVLINDCRNQKASPLYTGPQEIKDNPYYQNPIPNSGAADYISGYSLYELMFNIW